MNFGQLKKYLGATRRLWRQHPLFLTRSDAVFTVHGLGEELFELFVLKHLERGAPYLFQVGANKGNARHDLIDLIKSHELPGLLLEPQPDVFESLRRNYSDVPSIKVANIALSTQNEERQIYRISASASMYHRDSARFGDGIASFSEDHVWKYFQKWASEEGKRQPRRKILEAIPVQCRTFSEIASCYSVRAIDILMVDTEGFDFEILKLVNIDTYKPQLIKFEHRHLGPDQVQAWNYLLDRGYELFVLQQSGNTFARLTQD